MIPTVHTGKGLSVPICQTGADEYDAPSFTVNNGVTDYDVRGTVVTSFVNVNICTCLSIRTDQTITVKLNATTNAAIEVHSGDSPFIIPSGFPISQIYITNASGFAAAVRLFML